MPLKSFRSMRIIYGYIREVREANKGHIRAFGEVKHIIIKISVRGMYIFIIFMIDSIYLSFIDR